jgi:hypothetical protein
MSDQEEVRIRGQGRASAPLFPLTFSLTLTYRDRHTYI